jgi:hypothetical protein
MHIEDFKSEPIFSIPYRGIDTDGIIRDHEYPVFECHASGLPEGIEAMVCTSDLQGMYYSESRKKNELAGIHVAEEMALFLEIERKIDPKRTLAILAGDFFCQPDLSGRGGFGFVDEVWYAFASAFGYVAGVTGNHDNFRTNFQKVISNSHLLHDEARHTQELIIAGIGGIIGQSTKRPLRHAEEDFKAMFYRNLATRPDILILHENPESFDPSFAHLSKLGTNPATSPLIVFGHRKLPEPLIELGNGMQLLNVNERVVIIRQEA